MKEIDAESMRAADKGSKLGDLHLPWLNAKPRCCQSGGRRIRHTIEAN
jgi:hypothetical protein